MASRILVVCYSRGGATFEVARYVAEALDADLDRIEDCSSRKGVTGYVKSAIEAFAKGVPTIHTLRDPRDYDFVVLGSPVWAGTLASPVRSYLAAHPGKIRLAGCFALMTAMGGEDVIHEIELACGENSGPNCVLNDLDVKRERYREKCAPFLTALRDRVTGASARKSERVSAA
jgi:flavodoxin